MWVVILLVVLAIVTGVFGAIVEGLLWLFTVFFALIAVVVLWNRMRHGSGGSSSRG